MADIIEAGDGEFLTIYGMMVFRAGGVRQAEINRLDRTR
jgi:hypothetical protein